MLKNLTQEAIRQTELERHNSGVTEITFYEMEIERFLASGKYKNMLVAERYYKGDHDILCNGRKEINESGELVDVENAIDNRIIDNRYAEVVDQKANYLVGSPFVVASDDKRHEKVLENIFNKNFKRIFKNGSKNGINCGVFYLMPYYNDTGEFKFKVLKGYEVIPLWSDSDHTILDQAIRILPTEHYEENKIEIVIHVEIFRVDGVLRFIYQDGRLKPDTELDKNSPDEVEPYFYLGQEKKTLGAWNKTPIIAFKTNSYEIPLIIRVKGLQDGINKILSTFQNHMEEDHRSTILLLTNYDGTDLTELRRNISTYGVVKLKTVDGTQGKLEALTVEVNSQNYMDILDVLKQAIIRNGRGYDANDSRIQGQPNQMNIQSMYTNIDLDADDTEMEYQASFEQLLYFINIHLGYTDTGIQVDTFDITFKRDMLMVESEIISNILSSRGLVSDKTLRKYHPYVTDEEEEERLLLEENQNNVQNYLNKNFPIEHVVN